MTGETIAHYRVLDKLGQGGMGVVYKAEDLRLRRLVALKFLNDDVFGAAVGRKRFLYEAQAAAVIEHPNVCSVYGYEEAGDYVFIVMAFVEGTSLDVLLKRGVDQREAARIAIEIGEGLKAAHAKRIVHRDIKPGNILITAEGQVKITDFGLALLTERTRITMPGTVMGTVTYMSPEQALAKPVDRRSDIWSLAVVLCEMLTGKLPFRGNDVHSTLESVIRAPLPELRVGGRPLPPFLKSIITKALAKNPDERYQHIDDLVVDLRAVQRELTADSPPVPTPGSGSMAGDSMTRTQSMVMQDTGKAAPRSLRAFLQFVADKLRGRPDSE